MFSSNSMVTTQTLLRVMDSILVTLEFSAIFFSSLRVTRSSTFSAAAPGQGQMARATRTGMSGSLRSGMFK